MYPLGIGWTIARFSTTSRQGRRANVRYSYPLEMRFTYRDNFRVANHRGAIRRTVETVIEDSLPDAFFWAALANPAVTRITLRVKTRLFVHGPHLS